MSRETGLKGVVRGIADERSVVRADREERAVAVDQYGIEAIVDALLAAHLAVKIFGGVEWIVRFGHVIRQKRCIPLGIFPSSRPSSPPSASRCRRRFAREALP